MTSYARKTKRHSLYMLAAFAAIAAALSLAIAGTCVPDRAIAAENLAPAQTSGTPAGQVEAQATNVQNGWVTTSKGKSYYRKGAKVTGLQKIGKKRYFFSGTGLMRTGVVKSGKATYYLSDDGVLEGAKLGSTYYYNTLKPMTTTDVYDFKAFQKAHSIVRSISNKGDSKAAKLRKAFDWVIARTYSIHRNFSPSMTNWPAIYANDHFTEIGGDCHADGAAFAYLAAAIGYKADVCIDSMNSGYAPSHCWTMIGNAVYDPLFAESKSYSAYYGVTSGTYETNPVARYSVPRYNPANAKKTAKASKALVDSGKEGLHRENGACYFYVKGVKAKNAWKKVGINRYYFKSNGKAATGSFKVGKTYFVFAKDGHLLRGKATRIVKIGTAAYRVSAAGKAVSGWSKGRAQRFDATGKLLRGVSLQSGALYAANNAGAYNVKRTRQLNAAAAKGQQASTLKTLLGKPKQTIYSKSCNFNGDDGLWVYSNFAVLTARPANGNPEYVVKIQGR